MESFVIPKSTRIGLAIRAEVEPVTANTTIMTKTCQSDVMFQRSLKLLMVCIKTQIYSIYCGVTNTEWSSLLVIWK